MKGRENNYTAGYTTHTSSDSDYALLADQAL